MVTSKNSKTANAIGRVTLPDIHSHARALQSTLAAAKLRLRAGLTEPRRQQDPGSNRHSLTLTCY